MRSAFIDHDTQTLKATTNLMQIKHHSHFSLVLRDKGLDLLQVGADHLVDLGMTDTEGIIVLVGKIALSAMAWVNPKSSTISFFDVAFTLY